MQIYLAIREILADKALIATDSLISQLFVVAFVHPAYVRIALIWGFPAQLSLWKSVHWLWRYKLNKVRDIRKLNNMEEARMMKEERNDWTKMYHKMLKGLEAMIDVQKQVKDIMKIAMETNTMVTEMEDTILKASINNRVLNTTNIAGVSEDLWYLIQSDMENQIFQVQQMLADKLDAYKRKGNTYVDDNIQEI